MPDFRAYVGQNLPPLGVSAVCEAEVVEELALEFEENYERALRTGLSPDQAWREVRDRARSWREWGDDLRTALGGHPGEVAGGARREDRLSRFREELGRDLVYGGRQLLKSPGFTIVAVLMLALGIGANTAIFSLLNAILLRNLPVREPGQLVLFGEAQASGTTSFMPHGSTQIFSYPFFREFRPRNQVVWNVAAVQSFLAASHGRIAGDASMERLNVELVSGAYFSTLGVNAALGRVFTGADDQTPGAHPVAVASYAWWQNRFAGDPSIRGQTITNAPAVYTIVGADR